MIQETSAQDLACKQIGAAFAGDWSTLERLYADDVQYLDPDTRLNSCAAVLDHLRGQVDAFAGFQYTISHTYGDNADGAVVEWNMSGDYDGKPVSLDIVTGLPLPRRPHHLRAQLLGQRRAPSPTRLIRPQ